MPGFFHMIRMSKSFPYSMTCKLDSEHTASGQMYACIAFLESCLLQGSLRLKETSSSSGSARLKQEASHNGAAKMWGFHQTLGNLKGEPELVVNLRPILGPSDVSGVLCDSLRFCKKRIVCQAIHDLHPCRELFYCNLLSCDLYHSLLSRNLHHLHNCKSCICSLQ